MVQALLVVLHVAFSSPLFHHMHQPNFSEFSGIALILAASFLKHNTKNLHLNTPTGFLSRPFPHFKHSPFLTGIEVLSFFLQTKTFIFSKFTLTIYSLKEGSREVSIKTLHSFLSLYFRKSFRLTGECVCNHKTSLPIIFAF